MLIATPTTPTPPAVFPPAPVVFEPGEIALEIFDTVPRWAIVHAAADESCAPLIRAGEIAIIESDGRTGVIPQRGGLYLIEHVSRGAARYERERRTRSIIQAREHQRGGWYASPYRSHFGRQLYFADGLYPDELALAEKLIGRVVGIFGPSRRGGC